MCDEDTIYGTITGDIQEGITSSIYVFSCGEPQPHSTVTTDSQGYYAIGGLEDGRYLIGASYAGYSFSKSLWVDIPCLLPESYDFISSLITYEISGKITGEVQEGVTLTLSGDDDATAISTENGTYSFIDLVPGTYTITASMTNFTFEPVSEVVQLVDSDTTSVDFTAIFQPPRFIDNDDGTVTDTATNLTWLKNANCYGSQTWTTALSLAGNLYEGECDLWEWPEGDWRLPTKEELQGIGTDPPATWDTEYPSVTWTMPGEPFINVRPGPYWSSNTYDSNHAWAVEMHDGSSFSRDKDYADYVWPVRSDPIEAVWEYDIGSDVDHSPAVAGEYVYVGNNYGMVFCLNAATGVKVWEYANGSDALAVSGGYVYVGDYDYKVLCLNADNGTIVWEYTIVGNLRSSPTVSGDYVYLSTGVKVYCLNVATGAKIWESAIEANDSPAVSGSYVYVRRGDGKIYCLDAATGAFVWEYEILTYSDTSPVVSSGYVYVGSWGDPVFCLNAVNGFKNMGIYPI
jgi:outer membrane protein assembly factor BamB